MSDSRVRRLPQDSSACSFTTSLGSLSSLSLTNRGCLRRSPEVHSRKSTCATRSGRSHTHFFILSAVRASPQRDGRLSGRLTNGKVEETKVRSFSKTSRREAGTKSL